MNKIITVLLICISAILSEKAFSQSAMANVSARHFISLNGKWNVIPDPTGSGNYREVWKERKPQKKTDFVEYSFDGSPLVNVPGVLWVIFVFSGLLGMHRSFGVEQPERAIDGLLASPVAREAIFLGKAFASLVFIVAVQAVAIPAVGLFYNLPLGAVALPLAGIALLAAIGLVVVGTLFSAMAVNTRLAELLLPMLALPFFVPIVIPAAQATAKLMSGRPVGDAVAWLKLLLAFDIVFIVACTLAYPFTLEE
jgi:heme exporter protein B